MTESIRSHCRLGIVHFMAYPECMRGEGPILETLTELAEDPYFTAVEITHIRDDQVRDQARAILTQAGLRWTYGAQPVLLSQGLSLNHPEAVERKKAVARVIECADEAVAVGAMGLAVLSGKTPEDGDIETATSLLVESLEEISEKCAPHGLPLVLETFDRVPYGKNCLIGPTAEAVRLSERVRRRYPKFGLMLDLSHLPLLDETPGHALAAAKEHLVHAHMGNCLKSDPSHPAYGDEHPYFGIEGGENGVVELTDYLKQLLAIGYLSKGGESFLSFEVKPIRPWGHTTGPAVANCKRALDAAWART